MENPAQLFPLTDEQLAQWRLDIHNLYLAAQAVTEKARYRERLYRRYSKRHIAMMDRKAREDIGQSS